MRICYFPLQTFKAGNPGSARGANICSSNIEDDDVDVTTIPPPMPHPGTAGLDTADVELVYFDLETTGLSIFLCLYHIFMSSVILRKDYLCSLIMELKVKA